MLFAASRLRLKPTGIQSTASSLVFRQGEKVGEGCYEVLGYRTSGRFASVWLARDATGSTVVIKV